MRKSKRLRFQRFHLRFHFYFGCFFETVSTLDGGHLPHERKTVEVQNDNLYDHEDHFEFEMNKLNCFMREVQAH